MNKLDLNKYTDVIRLEVRGESMWDKYNSDLRVAYQEQIL